MGQACSGEIQARLAAAEALLGPPSPRLVETLAAAAREEVGDWSGTYQPEFVNGMLLAVWPQVEGFSKIILKQTIEPAIRKALGTLGDAFSIDMDGYSLGDVPAKFGQMIITPGTQITDDGDLKVMKVRANVEWHGNIKMYVGLHGIKCGVTKVHMKGEMLMELVGTCPKPPLFQGARACFLNAPHLKLEYDVGVMNSVLKLAPIATVMQKVLIEQVSEKLVIPNRMGFRLDCACEMFRILKPRPEGLLKIMFIKAEGLLAMDMTLVSKKTSDPVLSIRCGAMSSESPVVYGTCDPTFDWVCLLPIDLPHDQLLDIEVFDRDKFKPDEFLGRIENKVVDLIESGGKDICLELCDASGNRGYNGKLYFRTEWRPLQMPQDVMSIKSMLSAHSAVVFVGMYFARRLPPRVDGTRYFVEIQVSHRLGLTGSDVSKPRVTPKNELIDVAPPDVDSVKERRLYEEKKAICMKYNMAKEEIAQILEVDVAKLDNADPSHLLHKEVLWNYGVDFFITNLSEAVIDIKLKHTDTRRGSVVSMNLDGVTIHTWQISVADIIKAQCEPDHTPVRDLEVPNSATSLHSRLQVRCLGEPRTSI